MSVCFEEKNGSADFVAPKLDNSNLIACHEKARSRGKQHTL